MKKKKLTNSDEIAKLYTDTYRTRMPLYNDYVFHRIYGSDTEESKAALIGLLNIILERKDDPIRHIEITNPIDLGEWMPDKDTTMDIKAKTDSGELLTIEMQVDKLTYYRNRALFYGGRLVNSSLKSGEPYDKMRKSIVVSIINPKLFPKEIGCHSIFDVREQNTGRKPIEKMTQIEKLAVYLRYANDENYKDSVQEICGSEEEIVMAENLYRKVTQEEKEAAWAESRFYYQLEYATEMKAAREKGLAEGLAEGRAEGRSEGEAAGAAQKQREIAKSMKEKNIPTADIAEMTGLSAEEVEEL